MLKLTCFVCTSIYNCCLPLTGSYYNTDDQHNMTTVTITRNQAREWSSNPIPLPVSEVDVEEIVVNFPCKFKSILTSNIENVQPSKIFVVPIRILYPCDW